MRVIISIIIAIPVMLMAFVLPLFENVKNEFLEICVAPQLTLKTCILFVLCTPVLFGIGKPLYHI